MSNNLRKKSYTIYTEESIKEAVNILNDIAPKRGLILILGNQICPVPIYDFDRYREIIQSKRGKPLNPFELDKKWFSHIELQRLISANFLPENENFVCILRLVRRNIVRAIITTNYDGYLEAAFLRYGDTYKCIRNPCMSALISQGIEWNSDGYYSKLSGSESDIPLWKIHGDFGFVRIDRCNHICRLPAFRIEKIRAPKASEPFLCHFTELKEDGSQYGGDSFLGRNHPGPCYQHNIDFGVSRLLFHPEASEAKKQLIDHCAAGGVILILGLTFNPKFPEDLTDVLARTSQDVPLIYAVASETKIKTRQSELLFKLENSNRDFVLLNECNEDKLLNNVLLEILFRLGETDIDEEYAEWVKGDKYWHA